MAWDMPTCATLGAILKMKALNHIGGVFGDNSQSQSSLGLTVLSLPLNSSCSPLPCWSSQNRFGISAWLKVENLNSTTCCLKVLKTRTQNALPTEY